MNHVRHSNIYTVPPHFSVGLVGAGGLGAMTALVLTKMGVNLMSVWDDDVVSEVNIPTQLHKWSEIDQPKVFSLARTLEEFSDEVAPCGYPERVTEDTDFNAHHLVIAAVDSIQARKDIWTATTRSPSVQWFIDMRMAAEELQIFVVAMHDLQAIEHYHELLFRLQDGDVPELTCTAKATFHCASMAAAHVGKILRDIVRREANSHRLVHYIPQNHLRVFDL